MSQEIRVFVRFKSGELREYYNIVCVKAEENKITLTDFLGGVGILQMEDVKDYKIVVI